MTRTGRRGLARPEVAAVVAALIVGAGPVAAQTADMIERARTEIIRRHDLQLELPRDVEPPAEWHLQLPQELLWVAVAAGLLWLLYVLKDVIPVWRRSGNGAWPESATGGETAARPADEVTMAADELARQGRFVDAMHVLLLRSLADIRERLGERFADSLTSREILRGTRLSEKGRAALREIIARVEWSYFGEHPAAAADYQACRDSFNALAEALQGEARA